MEINPVVFITFDYSIADSFCSSILLEPNRNYVFVKVLDSTLDTQTSAILIATFSKLLLFKYNGYIPPQVQALFKNRSIIKIIHCNNGKVDELEKIKSRFKISNHDCLNLEDLFFIVGLDFFPTDPSTLRLSSAEIVLNFQRCYAKEFDQFSFSTEFEELHVHWFMVTLSAFANLFVKENSGTIWKSDELRQREIDSFFRPEVK